MTEAWIIDGVRSPRGRGKPGVGSLSEIHPQRVMAQVLNGLKDKVGFDPADVEDVVAGNGYGDHNRKDIGVGGDYYYRNNVWSGTGKNKG